jgi:DNA-binding NtrC family response regulator
LGENELFGHIRGAYTDASSPEKGLIAEAEGGTLFLDEVDSLSKSAQVKLLRFLQDREYRPLGSARSQRANVRVLAATNADLWHLVQSKQFREDLYYRINVMVLRLPPLRERIEDIAPLALHFLHRYATRYRREAQQFSAEALNKLRAYGWPGNVRELETVVQRSLLLTSSSIIRADDIELPVPYECTGSGDASFREAKLRVIEQFERAYLISLLSAHKGNITQAAKQAGKERRAFARLLQKHQLAGNAFRV